MPTPLDINSEYYSLPNDHSISSVFLPNDAPHRQKYLTDFDFEKLLKSSEHYQYPLANYPSNSSSTINFQHHIKDFEYDKANYLLSENKREYLGFWGAKFYADSDPSKFKSPTPSPLSSPPLSPLLSPYSLPRFEAIDNQELPSLLFLPIPSEEFDNQEQSPPPPPPPRFEANSNQEQSSESHQEISLLANQEPNSLQEQIFDRLNIECKAIEVLSTTTSGMAPESMETAREMLSENQEPSTFENRLQPISFFPNNEVNYDRPNKSCCSPILSLFRKLKQSNKIAK